MIGQLSITMVFAGLLQALAMWSLASRWIKLSMLYGRLGIAYWITLLCLGKSPADSVAGDARGGGRRIRRIIFVLARRNVDA